jgi:hypothetical protein
LNGGTVHDQPDDDIGTWSIERLEAHAVALARGDMTLETIRVLAQSHAYQPDPDEDRRARLRWAKLSLHANERGHSERPPDRARMLSNNFMFRTWVIVHLGPDSTDTDWSPEALAADTLAALTLEPGQAAAIAASWRKLPFGQIRELRDHKNLTLHLGNLIGYLAPGSAKDQLTAWIGAREDLP